MEFLGRFRDNGYLNISRIDRIIAKAEEEVQEHIRQQEDWDLYPYWDLYSWKCRFVFIPEKQGCGVQI